tara:strand:- start:433 stop:597 length:165 start_codon:yes stop_codon:yes gene_type:complete
MSWDTVEKSEPYGKSLTRGSFTAFMPRVFPIAQAIGFLQKAKSFSLETNIKKGN